MKTGIELITEERLRQIDKEGWSEEHDDNEHSCGGLLMAAIAYAEHVRVRGWNILTPPHTVNKKDAARFYMQINAPANWPWARKWWKPKSPIRDLVKSGALIAAEIDRLQRESERA